MFRVREYTIIRKTWRTSIIEIYAMKLYCRENLIFICNHLTVLVEALEE